ncbi:peptidase [Halobacillus salinus]|uniref:Peptidase n=1 Tax=Halobacillus salinus TaxID=192814 RepID=A0A4Z0GXJ8_9BACI|nr:peptidase [Halobacillus salinus]TGB02465.1 peptidase [Halobacillus salinus]
MIPINEEVKSFINNQREDYVDLLKQMVQRESLAGHEASVQDLVEERLNSNGLMVDRWELDYKQLSKHPEFCASRTDFEGSENVVGVWKGEGGGKSLILNGHVDVVPEGELDQWDKAPYSGEVKGGRLYGRGSTDMKGGNLASLIALEALKKTGVRLKGDVIFQSVVEEEAGGSGTLSTIERGYKADAALIPEPTNLAIFPVQQGSMWFKVHIYGKSAHGGTRYEGISAIEKAFKVNEAILSLERERNELLSRDLYDGNPIPVPINIGTINGGNWPSSVPDHLEMEGRMGVIPGEIPQQAKSEMEERLRKLSEQDEWFAEHPVKIEWFGARWLPGEIDENHPFLERLEESYTSHKGQAPVMKASPWGTDGGLLSTIGNIPTVVFGPGTTSEAHQPNESIELDAIFDCATIMADTILEWCEVAERKEE